MSAHGSWHRAPKTLETSWVTEDGHQKDQDMIRSLKLSTPLPILPRGAGNKVNDWSYMCSEASIKLSKVQVREASRLVTHEGARRAVHSGRAWKLCTSSHTPFPMHLFHLNVHLYLLSYPSRKQCVNCFPKFYEPF